VLRRVPQLFLQQLPEQVLFFLLQALLQAF
jgi:hypothetical protein